MTPCDENRRNSYNQPREEMSAIPVPRLNNKMAHSHNGYVDDEDNVDVAEEGKRWCSCCRTKQRPGPKLPKVSEKKQCIKYCRNFVTFLFSHIGLTLLVVAYSALGGYIFMTLEGPFEIKQRSEVGTIRQHAVDRLWNYTESLNILNKDHWKKSVNDKLKDFQLQVFKAVKEGGWDGSDETTAIGELQWSFPGALLYSVTVITTIGYGHIAPKTAAGRLITIAYAVVGIPLTLLCLANVGNVLASGFRVFYTQVLCCMCCDKNTKGEPVITAVRREIAPTSTHPINPGMAIREPIYGNLIDGNVIPLNTVISTLEDDRDAQPVTIPVLVTLLFMVGYILCGTLLFTMWEDNWDFVEGIYFCFITLSTIGFGDFVPGTSINTWHNEGKQVMCTFYLLFGLATIAMCFELMQAQVRETCRTIGEKIGIL